MDKKVPIVLILTLALQGAGIIWWGSDLNRTVSTHADQIRELRALDAARALEERRVAIALGVLQNEVAGQTRILERMERALTNNGEPRR